MVEQKIKSIFKRGSKTYYYSSIFFPKNIREDVSKLYSFVRKADDYVDAIPQQKDEFLDFVSQYHNALNGEKSGNMVIDEFISLIHKQDFDPDWIDAFLHSMEMDTYKDTYDNIDELKEYLYGSAEVIGLMMAKIMDLPEESYEPARYLGRAMQYINFIRDVEEDIRLNRLYLSSKTLKKYGLRSLNFEETSKKKNEFKGFIDEQIDLYFEWQEKAEEGFKYIPRRYLIPIKTASDMYKWTAKKIRINPFTVYESKIKPSKLLIVKQGFYNTIFGNTKIFKANPLKRKGRAC
ncbi:MAG: phytoene/squalene synthase family protein [Thermoplasmatota archaeon]